MGQDQSSTLGGDSPSSSSSLPSFLASKAKGISPKPGRGGAGKVIVVKSGTENDQANVPDEELLKLQEIPMFYPILRNALNIPDVKDPPDLLTKFDHRSTLAICQRFQDHLAATSDVVASEQASLGTRVREIDYAVATMSNLLIDRDKSMTRMTADLSKLKEINTQISKITIQLQEIVPMANELCADINRLLASSTSSSSTSLSTDGDHRPTADHRSPPDEYHRIPPLNFSFILKQPDMPVVLTSNDPIARGQQLFGTEEHRVVDKSDD